MPVDALTTWHMLISSGPSCGTRESRTEKWIGDPFSVKLQTAEPADWSWSPSPPSSSFWNFWRSGLVRSAFPWAFTTHSTSASSQQKKPGLPLTRRACAHVFWVEIQSHCGLLVVWIHVHPAVKHLKGQTWSNTVMFSPCYLEASKCNKFSGNKAPSSKIHHNRPIFQHKFKGWPQCHMLRPVGQETLLLLRLRSFRRNVGKRW